MFIWKCWESEKNINSPKNRTYSPKNRTGYKMEKNIKYFLIKVVSLVALIFLTRVLFQFPIEYFSLKLFKQTAANILFNKIAALEVLAVVAFSFGLYYRTRISKFNHPRINWLKSILFLVLGEIMVAIYYLARASTNLFNITGGITLLAIQAAIFIALAIAFIFFAIAVFDMNYLKKFVQAFKKPLIIAAAITVILYFLLILFQSQWLFFSEGVSNLLNKSLSLFYPVQQSFIKSTPVLKINDFAVSIGAPCSGIDSMFLFTAFFAALFALDNKRIKKGIYAISFIIGLIGVYFVNVLRLFLLLVAGVEISPRFAIGLFHTNAGWVFFIAYFLCYYLIIKRFIYMPNSPGEAEKK